jgi:glycosyltransferase involved in cell wall biosynthesis
MLASSNKRSDLNLNPDAQHLHDRRILVFDFCLDGHHPGYILHVIRYWRSHDLPGHLDILVLPQFLQLHPDVVAAAGDVGISRVRFVSITEAEANTLPANSSFWARRQLALREWTLLCEYAARLGSREIVLMYFDTYQLPLLIGQQAPCSVSGIYFRPRFHYGRFEGYAPSWRERFHLQREKLYLAWVLQNSRLKRIYSLDPFVVEDLNHFKTNTKAIHLPDPVQVYPQTESDLQQVRSRLGIESRRQVFLQFGDLSDPRKGVKHVLAATSQLSPELCRNLCLVFVGPMNGQRKAIVQPQIQQLLQSLPVQIITNFQFVSEVEIQPYFQSADVILAPYQHHVGMSAILVRAAAAQKPVLGSNYGLMGEVIRRHQLGVAVDTTVVEEVAQALTTCLTTPLATLGDRTAMQNFANQNSAQNFAYTLFQHLS